MRADLSTANERVLRTQNLVRWVLRRVSATVYVPPDVREDVYAAGVMGLVRAARRFQPGRGSWIGYAIPAIRGAMLDWLTWWNAGRVQRVPLEAALNVPAADAGLEARLTVAEILSAAPEAERTALEAYMRDEVVADLDSAFAGARSRLGIVVRDVEALGRTFPAARFWSHVPDRPEDGCWLWRGTTTRQGYGQFSVDEGGRRWRHYLAHRVAWLLAHGELPRGVRVVQACGERRCVRPDHLRASTRRLAALAAVLAALLLGGCGGPAEPPRAAEMRDEAFGTRGEFDATGICRPPREVFESWLAERDEYLLVTLCEREGAPHVDIKLRDDGRRFRRRILAPPPAAVES